MGRHPVARSLQMTVCAWSDYELDNVLNDSANESKKQNVF
jgi:hypothetical protein